MKKILVAVLSLGMILSLGACGSKSSAESVSGSSASGEIKVVQDGKLHMATNASFPPYEMTTDEGGYEGIDVEIAEEIAKKLGLELVVDDMDFSSVITSVQNGKSDIAMAGLTVNEERKKNINFTDTYAKAVQSIIVPEDSAIKSVDDLGNAKAIGCQEGTTGYIYCSDTEENGGYGDKAIAYTDGATAVQALTTGKVEAVVIDNEPAKAFVEANKGLKILDTAFAEEEYAIGISKKNDGLRTAVNKALKELIEDGTVQKIVDKYIKA